MPQPLEDEFGDIIKKARRGMSYSAEDVQRQTGIDSSVLAAFEGYHRKPTAKEVRALAAVLRLNAEKLREIARSAWEPQPTPWLSEGTALVVAVPVSVGGYVENSYIIGCRVSRRAIIIDPGGAPDAIVQATSEAGLAPDAIAITHGHSDHTDAVGTLAARFGSAIVIGHEEGLRSVQDSRAQMRQVNDGDEFRIGDLRFRVLHTPGHTFGSCCYLTGLICCVGDTIFAGSVGGATGGPASYRTLLDSIKTKLFALPPTTALLPGHGPATTVREELDHNPFF